MKSSFRPKREDLAYVSENWIATRTYMVRRDVAGSKFKEFQNLLVGRYNMGEWSDADAEKACKQVIPNLDGYAEINTLVVHRSQVQEMDGKRGVFECFYITYLCGETEIGINPDFAALLSYGDKVLAKNETSPIVIQKNGEIVAVVMPVRISKMKGAKK